MRQRRHDPGLIPTRRQPKTADAKRRDGASGKQSPVDPEACGGEFRSDQSQHRRERGHRNHSANAEGDQIRDRLSVRGKCQSGQHAKEMGTPRQSMQRADAECRMTVMMSASPLMHCAVFVRVKMNMPFAVVFMFVSVDRVMKRATQGPQTYST
jgi:hypothetical protein